MALVDELTARIADAMRSKDALRLSTLRMLKAALMNREIERGHALDDGESLQVVASLVKQRTDSIEQFTKGGRPELADKEQAEIHVLEALSSGGRRPGRGRTGRRRRDPGDRRDVSRRTWAG